MRNTHPPETFQIRFSPRILVGDAEAIPSGAEIEEPVPEVAATRAAPTARQQRPKSSAKPLSNISLAGFGQDMGLATSDNDEDRLFAREALDLLAARMRWGPVGQIQGQSQGHGSRGRGGGNLK
jgi:hypothetical protein